MQVNKMNSRKEFFRVSLSEIEKELGKLKQGEDFTVKLWTDKAVATQYQETRDIQSDPDKNEKWLARQKAVTERQLRLDMLKLPVPRPAQAEIETSEA
jgi:hypothetical protein